MLVARLGAFHRSFSTALFGRIPEINLAKFLSTDHTDVEECKEAAKGLREIGFLLVKDPRVHQADHVKLVNMLGKYFESRAKKYVRGDTIDEAFPENAYRFGVMPEYCRRPPDYLNTWKRFKEENRPHVRIPPALDPQWRYSWRIGDELPNNRRFESKKISPGDFPSWASTMDAYGSALLGTVFSISEVLAIGLGLKRTLFHDRLIYGSHTLTPTGIDLGRHNALGAVILGFNLGESPNQCLASFLPL
jgi:isopenicillin N synthase-like dioxygenase